jgi:hypothetical protein
MPTFPESDIGHASVEGGLSWPIEARLMERRLTAVFVKDFLWQRTDRGWREQWVPLGEGMVDRAFFQWLKTTNFSGPISQHHEYDHGAGRFAMTSQRALTSAATQLGVRRRPATTAGAGYRANTSTVSMRRPGNRGHSITSPSLWVATGLWKSISER